MKRLLLFLLLFLPQLAGAQIYIPQGATPEIIQDAITGRDLVLNRKYTEAEAYFHNLETKYPKSPLGLFGQMAILQSKMFENFDFRLDTNLKPITEKIKSINDVILKDPNATAWDLYLTGASSGVMAFYYIRADQLFKALSLAGDTKQALQMSVQKDPQFFDPWFGLGMYEFWRSVYTQKFKFLPFFKDQRQEGIRKMNLAIEKGGVGKPLAMAGIIFVYWEYHQYAKGLGIAQTLEQSYPGSAVAQILKGNMLTGLAKYQEALQVFMTMETKYPDIYLTRYFIGYCQIKLKRSQEARKSLEMFLQHKPAPAWEAYALYNLGHLDLSEGKTKEAFEKFKQGSRVYPDFKGNLQQVQKMRANNK